MLQSIRSQKGLDRRSIPGRLATHAQATAKRALGAGLVAYWRRREPPQIPAMPFSMNLADNLQVSMNLVMPLADPSPIARADMARALFSVLDQVVVGLNNTGIVHTARFSFVEDNFCMFSTYDGDFSNYIRDFIYNIGNAFDALLVFIKDPPPLPVEDNPDAFIDWVLARDSLQMPESVTLLSDAIATLPRKLVLMLDARRNVQLFAYRAYPAYSVGQIRDALEIGW